MIIGIQGVPEFRFRLTRRQVDDLIKLATGHYDATCRSAAVAPPIGSGFLLKWRRLIVNVPSMKLRASFSELDIAAKIMEVAKWMPLGDVDMAGIREMQDDFGKAMERANIAYGQWKA